MSERESPTIYDLFYTDPSGQASISADTMEPFRAELRTQGLSHLWRDTVRQSNSGLRKLLSPSLGQILAGAWNGYGDFIKVRDESRRDPETPRYFRAGKHTIECEHKPKLQLIVNGIPSTELPFTIKLTLTLQAILITIEAGHVVALEPDSCAGEGTLRCGQAFLAAFGPHTIDLPGRITLRDERVPA